MHFSVMRNSGVNCTRDETEKRCPNPTSVRMAGHWLLYGLPDQYLCCVQEHQIHGSPHYAVVLPRSVRGEALGLLRYPLTLGIWLGFHFAVLSFDRPFLDYRWGAEDPLRFGRVALQDQVSVIE